MFSCLNMGLSICLNYTLNKMNVDEINKLSREVIGAATEVHSILGPGLLEHTYQIALKKEIEFRGYNVESEVEIPIMYKGMNLNSSYRLDLLVENEIILELKATEQDSRLYSRQLYTYLKLSNKKLGFVINFNRPRLLNGLQRVVNGL